MLHQHTTLQTEFSSLWTSPTLGCSRYLLLLWEGFRNTCEVVPLLAKHELLVFALIPSLITSIIISDYIEMLFLGLRAASDVHKYSWFMVHLSKCLFVPSGLGGACAVLLFCWSQGKDSWLVASYHFCLKCQLYGKETH